MSYLRYSGALVMRITPGTGFKYRVSIKLNEEQKQREGAERDLQTVQFYAPVFEVYVQKTFPGTPEGGSLKLDAAAFEALTRAFHEGYPIDGYAHYDSTGGIVIARSERKNVENMREAALR